MPGFAILATTAQVRQGVDAAGVQPQWQRRDEHRGTTDIEAAVPGEECGPRLIQRQVLPGDDKDGHTCSVTGRKPILPDRIPRGIEPWSRIRPSKHVQRTRARVERVGGWRLCK